jgi:hypothetical protein
MPQITRLAVCIVLLASLAGCASTMRALWPGGVTAADEEWSGRKSGEVVSILGTGDPRAAAASAVFDLLGNPVFSTLGVLLPVTMLGEVAPRWIWCNGEGKDPTSCKACPAYCSAIPLGAEVNFAGKPVGPAGLLWRPKRLTADPFND